MSKDEFRLNWFGTLTIDNIENIVELLKELLTDKRYTFVACNEYIGGFRPEVRTSQRLKNCTNGSPFAVWYGDNNAYAGFNVCDSYGAWGLFTSAKENKYDGKFDAPYVAFEWNKVTITHRAASGSLLYWCVAVERGCEGDE